MPPAKMTTAASLGNDSGRTQLRNALTDYFHSRPPPSASGYPRWTAASNKRPPAGTPPANTIIADPVALVVSPFFPPAPRARAPA
jgi:hypothetical protein